MMVRTRRDGCVARITLDRPDRLNAVDEAMAAELLAALDAVRSSDARALVLDAVGRGFCAGRDLAGAKPLEEDGAEILRVTYNPLFSAIRDLHIPTISAVQGAALGVGLGLALACDITIAAADAKIGSPFANIGAVLDSGGHFHLVHRIGAHRALELIYTARLLSGSEAAAMGLVNQSVPADELSEVVSQLALKLADGPTAAFALSKRLVRRIEEDVMGFADAIDAEAAAQGVASRTADYGEGMTAFQDKRPPAFSGA